MGYIPYKKKLNINSEFQENTLEQKQQHETACDAISKSTSG